MNRSVGEINIQESSINQAIIQCQEKEKKNSCLVVRIVSFDTAGLHLLTFRILEPYFNVARFN